MNFRPRSARPYVRDGLASDQVALLPLRSTLVLRGQARSAWMHGIDLAANAERTGTRVSAAVPVHAAGKVPGHGRIEDACPT